MRCTTVSLFPEYFDSALRCSILGRAVAQGLVVVDHVHIRDFAEGRHRKVDDRPYGGGPGMVMMPEPIALAIESVRQPTSKVLCMSPQGEVLHPRLARELSQEEHIILLCGHYEGIDQRVIDQCVDLEVSIGDYVLTSGCPAALVLMDAVSRFIPGVLGNASSASQDSFEEGILDCPHFTRPECFRGVQVPEVLRSGHHAEVARWRRAEAERRTEARHRSFPQGRER